MMYIDDCLRSLTEYMTAPAESLTVRTYNVGAMSFTPEELFTAVKRRVPELEIEYKPDARQGIGMAKIFFTELLTINFPFSRHLAPGV